MCKIRKKLRILRKFSERKYSVSFIFYKFLFWDRFRNREGNEFFESDFFKKLIGYDRAHDPKRDLERRKLTSLINYWSQLLFEGNNIVFYKLRLVQLTFMVYWFLPIFILFFMIISCSFSWNIWGVLWQKSIIAYKTLSCTRGGWTPLVSGFSPFSYFLFFLILGYFPYFPMDLQLFSYLWGVWGVSWQKCIVIYDIPLDQGWLKRNGLLISPKFGTVRKEMTCGVP